jgi:hypothetical protein
MTDAAVVAGTERPNIRFERLVVDPQSVVWTALTDTGNSFGDGSRAMWS